MIGVLLLTALLLWMTAHAVASGVLLADADLFAGDEASDGWVEIT